MAKRMPDSGVSESDEYGRASSKNIETFPFTQPRGVPVPTVSLHQVRCNIAQLLIYVHAP
jgi:hypothetical protein